MLTTALRRLSVLTGYRAAVELARGPTVGFHNHSGSFSRIRDKTKKMSSCTEKQPTIIKSLNDKREYRFLVLKNGLQALLISDTDGCDEAEIEEDQSDSEAESDMSCGEGSVEEDGSDSEMEELGPDEEENTGERKSAAALCVGVGSFSDPSEIPGFAHFLEHMVFMGSEKYPEENNFDDYLSRHGGETNAWTDHERTCFYFDVERRQFRHALDKFAQFFVSPLLLQDSVDREIQAVDSEFQERLPSDNDRLNQLMACTAKENNPMSKFLLGNANTLKHHPAERGVNVYGRLRDFFDRYYTAQYMTLTVHSKHSLDTMEAWVKESFSDIHNNKESCLSFQEYKEPFNTPEFCKLYKVIPVEETHKVYLTWAFPPLQQQYKCKPLEYLSALMTHEGEGSIFSSLKKRGWAVELTGGNSGDGYDMNTTWSGYDVCVTLTDEGLKNVFEVIDVIFEYLHILKKQGPEQWRYEEQQKIEETRFRWKEQGDPTDYVEKVCDNMQLYPPEHFLNGHKLWFQYDKQVIQDCMDHLRADNCNVIISSTSFCESDCPLREHWFGTTYNVEEIGSAFISRWTDAKENAELFLPKPNTFIATDFSLKCLEPKDQSLAPKLIDSSPRHQLFYKKDTKFCVPKGFAWASLRSPVICDSLKSSALLDLFVSIVNQNMSEPTYPAIMAGYEIGVFVDECQSAVVIEVDGFNHRLQEVLQVVVDLIVNFECSDKLFEAMKAQLRKSYYNEIIKPLEASRMMRFQTIYNRYWPTCDKHRIVGDLQKADLLNLVKRFLHNVHLVSFIMGNFTPEEAKKTCDEIRKKLNSQETDGLLDVTNNTLQLEHQKRYCQIRGFNPEDTNSSIINYYQGSAGSLRRSCLNELLVTRMREPCFNTLRTKLQLGYSVCCWNYLNYGTFGLGICVEFQANKFSMQYVDGEIEKFLLEMRDILQGMSKDDFHSLVESVVTLKKVEDTHLEQEVSRHWREIQDETCLFDRHQREIVILKTLTLKDLQDWFQQEYLGDNQRKYSVQVVGVKDGVSSKPSRDQEQPVVCLVDPDQTGSTPVTDISAFKQTLAVLPVIKIVS